MSEEDGVELHRSHIELRQAHSGAAPCIKLKIDRTTTVVVVATAHQCSGSGEAIECRRSALRTRQGHNHAWRCLSRWCASCCQTKKGRFDKKGRLVHDCAPPGGTNTVRWENHMP